MYDLKVSGLLKLRASTRAISPASWLKFPTIQGPHLAPSLRSDVHLKMGAEMVPEISVK
jgi:hypothetical protein